MRPLLLALVLIAAGCLTPGHTAPTSPTAADALAPIVFSAPKILDPVRSGGEPIIFETPKHTLLIAAHPGFTHVKAPPGPELLQDANGQSYLYRSTDAGKTWTVVTGPANTPRNDAWGISDPDLATNADGSKLVMVDLQAVSVATQASADDGASWPSASPMVTDPQDGSVDRPWLTFANGHFYMLYNGDGNGHWRLRQSDDGVTWTDLSTPGDGSYPGAMVAGPDGSLYVGNGDKVWASTDQGKTFASSKVPAQKPMTGITAQRPAVDDAGTVYFAWSELHSIWYAASHDHGKTWGTPHALTADLPGTHIWPWPAAGAPGKLVVAWVGTTQKNDDPSAVTGDWLVHVAVVSDADTDHPVIQGGPVAGAKVTTGGICIDGTACEAEAKDRRLGDFITVIVDHAGLAQIAYGTTTTGHSISSPAYIVETGGPRLR
ncbi:MAG: hypothetical protein QOE90_3611 [Thermoplasmata archaeon]|jgi:hypothetical protein|nr:hypothetical protein [Thermoplasmata archaeon]